CNIRPAPNHHFFNIKLNYMAINLLVFDSHPVQYRVPIWQAMEKIHPGSIHVVYGSDCTIQGFADHEFGITFAWDVPMLAGYPSTILNCVKGKPLAGWGSLTGKGVKEMISQLAPSAVLLTGLNFRFDLTAYLEARRQGIPVWLRCETQDHAFRRSKLKTIVRSLIYKSAYLFLNRVFYIGELNKRHYLKHHVNPIKLKPARYGTEDKFAEIKSEDKLRLRSYTRKAAGAVSNAFVIGFSGKLIPKKNPELLFYMLDYLPAEVRARTHLYFVGSGELLEPLQHLATTALKKYGVKTFFAGFINQSQLPAHYLAMDIMVLPSRKMGETWGLVANEAMQAGCGVVVSNAVGCSADFYAWERFRVFKNGDALSLAGKVASLSHYPREFEWAKSKLQSYSIKATADSLLNELKLIK
ncbi:glycosyltransferase, partial [Pedobacter sp.]|uniref:glycosyltransferase n=1 Tax=Pedobacter sp. TaxID=1411316 RepID=UPI003D7FEA1F